jgi:hypothetical protein
MAFSLQATTISLFAAKPANLCSLHGKRPVRLRQAVDLARKIGHCFLV